MSQPDFDVENCTWQAKDGKVIKYTKETHQLTTWEDWNEYHLQITKWPKNTSIEIVVLSGDEGYDSESRWSSSEAEVLNDRKRLLKLVQQCIIAEL
ncbi:hypothetical protein [Microcoleus sp. POL10_C6]|uniref:hypothetical protein n=1 Tax=Microcoleus sp. POL10_C6 TaxID=2818852 RepID=UPI002FD65FDA